MTLRVHRDELLSAEIRDNVVELRFVGLKPRRIAIDELTSEARHWLLPSLAPRDIYTPAEEADLYGYADDDTTEAPSDTGGTGTPEHG